jgi:hypothetical protein
LGTWGTSREHDEHIENKEEKQKKTPPTPPPKGRNRAHHEHMLSLPIDDCMKFLFPKLFVTIFGLG